MNANIPRDEAPAPAPGKSFFDTLRGGVVSSVPALSAVVFIIVAVKVFRASNMETTTTVAIVSTADIVALLKGVILTLLPGFLAGVTAASIWWWAGVLPEWVDDEDAWQAAGRGLLSPQAVLAWALIVMAFFTIWWPVFLVLLLPVLSTTAAIAAGSLRRWLQKGTANSRTTNLTRLRRWLQKRTTISPRRRGMAFRLVAAAVLVCLLIVKVAVGISWPAFVVALVPLLVLPEAFMFGWWPPPRVAIPLRRTLRVFGLVAAAAFIGVLTLQPTVWLPLRTITVAGKKPVVLKGKEQPHRFPAYVLSRDKDGASLLLNKPRAVIQVGPDDIEPAMPLCVPPESRWRVLTVRASQVLGFDPDLHSPYDVCPDLPQRLLGG